MPVKRSTPTRRDPAVPWSTGLGVFHWPNEVNRDEALLAFFYNDVNALRADYRRAVIPGAALGSSSLARTVYLEKTPSGDAWVDFGLREYPRASPTNPSQDWIERPGNRIAVNLCVSGMNRRTAVKKLGLAAEFWAVFLSYEPSGPMNLPAQLERLTYGNVSATPGTEPIFLRGLSTLGRFTRVGERRGQHTTRWTTRT